MDKVKEMSPHVNRLMARINRLIANYLEDEMNGERFTVIGPVITTALVGVMAEQISLTLPQSEVWDLVSDENNRGVKKLLRVYRAEKKARNESV